MDKKEKLSKLNKRLGFLMKIQKENPHGREAMDYSIESISEKIQDLI